MHIDSHLLSNLDISPRLPENRYKLLHLMGYKYDQHVFYRLNEKLIKFQPLQLM